MRPPLHRIRHEALQGEWLEEKFPTPPLLPAAAGDRARVLALAAIVGCDIHPVNNRRILEALRKDFGADGAAIDRWCQTWIAAGFDAYEALLGAGPKRGRFSFGDAPTLADVYLVPQVDRQPSGTRSGEAAGGAGTVHCGSAGRHPQEFP
jgi:maleylacetoacetate isomerase